jgi:dihydroorotase
MTSLPAQRLGLADRGLLRPGMAADVVCFDPDAEFVVEPGNFSTKGRNTPFGGHHLKGRVVATVLDGRITYAATETLGAAAP